MLVEEVTVTNLLCQHHTSHCLLYYKMYWSLRELDVASPPGECEKHGFINLCSSENILGTLYPKQVHIPLSRGCTWADGSKEMSNLKRYSLTAVNTCNFHRTTMGLAESQTKVWACEEVWFSRYPWSRVQELGIILNFYKA